MKTKNLLTVLFIISRVLSNAQTWDVTGNTINTGDYLGTTNTQPLELRTNNTTTEQPILFVTNGTSERMRIAAGGNVGIGTGSPAYKLDVSGDVNVASNQVYRINGNTVLGDKSSASTPRNIFVGYQAGATLQGGSAASSSLGNTCVGAKAGYVLADGAIYNTLIGSNSGQALTTGDYNTLVGNLSGQAITTGEYNTILGTNAGYSLTSGLRNTFVGSSAGYTCQTGNYNVCIGDVAGRYTTSNENVFIGYASGNSNTSGQYNVFLGTGSGHLNTTSSENVFVGRNAGYNITGASNERNTFLGALCGNGGSLTDGDNVTLIGYNAEATNDLTNATAIGANAYVNANNSLILGGITGTNSGTNTNVGIGTTSPTSRLHVVNNAENIAGYFDATNAGMTDIVKAVYNQSSNAHKDGIEVSLINTTSSSGNYTNSGVRSTVDCDADGKTNIGIYGYASGDNNFENYGGKFEGYSGAVAADYNYGVWAKATGGDNNFGGYFEVQGEGTDASDNYAVYGEAGGSSNYYAAYFNGEGVLTGGSWTTSDINLKENITEINNSFDLINQLVPKSFTFRHDEYPGIFLPQGTNYGLIAQEVEIVIPHIVREIKHPADYDSLGNQINPSLSFKAINYLELIPFLIGAIKEQQQQIDDLSSQLISCCGPQIQEFQMPDNTQNGQHSTVSSQQLNATAKDLAVLSQNQPNPFNEKTTLRFYLPKGTKDAGIKVYDNTGSVYRLFALTGDGPGTIEIEGNTLEAGNYYYSLLIGGNVVDTKNMVITK